MRMSRVSPSVLGLLCACLALDLASAAPPPWAPAHGWRAKNDPFYVGYAGRQWSEDYGVTAGRCNTDSVLAAIGATAGAVIGNRAAREEHRTVATIVGAGRSSAPVTLTGCAGPDGEWVLRS